MATSTTSTEAEIIAEYWRNVFLNELRENLVFWQYGMVGTHPRGSGTLVHWLALDDLSAAAALTEGTDPDEYTLSAGDQTATVAQYGASVLVSDLLQDTWVSGSYQTLMERLARNAALTLDTVIRNTCFTAGGSAQYAGTAVDFNRTTKAAAVKKSFLNIWEGLRSCYDYLLNWWNYATIKLYEQLYDNPRQAYLATKSLYCWSY
jgi:N4-gp56 family major capsid protein